MAIDDPIDAVRKQIIEEEDAPGGVLKLFLEIAAPFEPLFGLCKNCLKYLIGTTPVSKRFEMLLNIMAGHEKEIDSIKEKLDSPEFVEALVVAVEHTVRTPNLRRVERFANVLGLTASQEDPNWEEAAEFIRLAAELNEEDIAVLTVMDEVDQELGGAERRWVQARANVSQVTQSKLKSLQIPNEEFDARAHRLNGFGLVRLLMNMKGGHQRQDLEIARPNGRGKRFLSLIRGDRRD